MSYERCTFCSGQGKRCNRTAMVNSLCFWHNPDIDKTDSTIKPRLEQLVADGQSLCGFQLEGARLDNICLMHTNSSQRVDMSEINLKRASLQNAHLYRANLEDSCLMKANLENASLNATILSGSNMLGACLYNTKLEQINWGKQIFQEKQIYELKKSKNNKHDLQEKYCEAEEVYRYLRRNCEQRGLSQDAGCFLYREMRCRRLALPFFTARRFGSWCMDMLCGYGEKPLYLIVFSILFILFCALGYLLTGIYSGKELIIVNPDMITEWQDIICVNFFKCIYFSVVTFTTLGYGDIIPVGAGRIIASIEALVGSFSIALYVVVFVRRMNR